jgi:hypothetical protein
MTKTPFPRHLLIVAAVGIGIALTLSGCFSMSSTISGAVSQSAEQPGQSASSQPAPQSQPSSPGAAVVYRYQFNAFYEAMWNFGWFGYKDANYHPGQGTAWQITNPRNSEGPTIFERAFLKANDDKTQWWRLKIAGGEAKDEIIYEFLGGADMTVQKVRYRDPGSGQIGEFIPNQSDSQQQRALSTPSRQQLANNLVGTESVQGREGTFAADHYSYTDAQSSYTGDIWISKTVPGYMVKFLSSDPRNNSTSNGELVHIETGVTTSLGSY